VPAFPQPPYRWAYKPPLGCELDHGHPLARGLVGCWLFNEQNGPTAYDLSPGGNAGTLGAETWAPCRWGVGLSDSGSGVALPSASYTTLTTNSVVFWLNPTTFTGIVPGFLDQMDGSNSHGFVWGTGLATQTNLGLRYGDGTTFQEIHGNTNLTTGSWQMLGGSWDDAGLAAAFYRNGLPDGTGSGPTHMSRAVAAVSPQLLSYTNGDGYRGSADHILLWNRVLDPAEFAALYADPFQMIRPPSSRRYFVMAAASAFAGDEDTGLTYSWSTRW
jgi:hypothetical protein